MIKNKANYLLVITSLILSLVVAEVILRLYGENLPNNKKSDSYTVYDCEKTRKSLKGYSSMDALLKDNGSRNFDYGKSFDGFDKVVLDTLCLTDNYYLDDRKMRRVKAFQNNTYLFNDLGYRGKNWGKEKQKNEKRVFLVGGSTAYSMFSNETNSIHQQLELLLNEGTNNVKYNVLSASIPGMGSSDEYRVLTNEIIKYSPDTVIFLTGFNNGRGGDANYYYDEGDSISTYGAKILELFIDKTFFVKTAELLYGLVKKPSIERVEVHQSLIKTTKMSANFCKDNNIKCIYALQPTLLVQRKSLTDAERRIRFIWLSANNDELPDASYYRKGYSKFEKLYNSIDNAFLDLTRLGSEGLYTGVLSPGEEIIISEGNPYKKILIQHNNASTFSISSEIFYPENSCDENTIILFPSNRIERHCKVSNAEHLKSYIINKEIYLSKHAGFHAGNKPIILNFKGFLNLEHLKIKFYIRNEQDTSNIKVTASISKNGTVFVNPQEKEQTYMKGNFEFDWDLGSYSGDAFIKLDFKNGGNIGLKTIKLEYYQVKDTKDIFNKKNNTIKNEGLSEIFVETFPSHKLDQIFVDSAHLTHIGNKLVATKITEAIINSTEE